MIDVVTLKKVWEILDRRERYGALVVLGIGVLAAFVSTAMIGSVMPFLAVLADPGRIESTAALAWLRDRLGIGSDYNFLLFLGGLSLGAIFVGSLMQLVRAYAVARYSLMRTHSVSLRLMESYLSRPYQFFLDQHTGELGTRVLAEAGQMVNGYLRPVLEMVLSIFSVVAIIAFLITVNPTVAIAAFVLLGGIYAVTFFAGKRALKRLGKERIETNSARFRLAGEALGGVKDIKLLGREYAYLQRFSKPSLRMATISVTVALISSLPQIIVQGVAMSGMIVLCLVLLDPVQLAGGGALSGILPVLGVFALAGQRLMPELGRVYGSFAKLQAFSAAVDRVHEDLREAERLPRRTEAGTGLRQGLRLENVGFQYPNAERPGLAGITLEIASTEKIGLVGSTGAGKTTLADLILGLILPTEGQMFVDGEALRPDRIRAWQQSVGYVPQYIFLTDTSIAENIALGVAPGDIDRARVERVAEIAQLGAFIRTELPHGFDTKVGERGVRLSGGQRQRIGIARALYHNAELIVFDEATSALDNLTEREVMNAIDALPGDKTILMIAHRLSTVRNCDRIIVLDRGSLVGFGTWDELMATNETFQRIARIGHAA